jgi:hypothetical protein
MNEYRIQWRHTDSRGYPRERILFVEANSTDDAEIIARHHIERNLGIEELEIASVDEVKPLPPGRVLGTEDTE